MTVTMNFFLGIWLLTRFVVDCHSYCTPVYGGEPCSFVPAASGNTPPCARPGMTYCEYIDQYPGQLIHHLVEKWVYDHRTLLSSESKEDFSSYFTPPPAPVYGPPGYHYGPPNTAQQPVNNYYPEPIHIPKPQFPFHDDGVTYLPPKSNFTVFTGRSNRAHTLNYKYTNSIPPVSRFYNNPLENYNGLVQQFPYQNNIWKRKVNSFERLKRSLRFKRSEKFYEKLIEARTSVNGTLVRRKRQSPSGETLCRSRSQYIVPKAALNNKGNWMYIVNMPEVDNRLSQLVKTETCISQTCNGICSLPDDYTSRCEQKYAQKRLVALESGGNQLYTDLFWFPSCCVCVISNT